MYFFFVLKIIFFLDMIVDSWPPDGLEALSWNLGEWPASGAQNVKFVKPHGLHTEATRTVCVIPTWNAIR